ncbi:ShlB/FhaC/HecB family hemolysin secretion/activation protein [Escherichia coli]|uniref:ShlB/FhaC/HecB family hemolysin secretion/activation protein n=8 Tax=Escherichia coli TaxID=562 RepID=UPI0028A53D48|nr:ShlB/FhaC/HecB family hemolysin secretion/activation protein [Escherichia coli]MDT3848672.1 ShlB/FhaC/HecB family hemolysin secretion/activation protein [Escherichia coli]
MQYRQENILTKASRLPHTLSISCYFVFRCVSPLVCYLSVFSVFFIPAFSSPAAMLSPGDRSAIQQQQQQLLDENQRQRDALERSAPLTITPSPETSAGTEGPCFTVSRIVVSGATRLTSAETDRLVAPWVNQCLNITGLTAVTDAVTDGYIRRGYITSRAFLTEQDLSGGVLHITVMEGRLQQIRAEGADLPVRTLKMVFPGMEGKVLNLRDIEQGMEQINRLRTEPVQIEISPGDREGWSVVTLTASPEWPVTGSVGFDNSGQKNTGTGQLNGVLSFNNPLGLADNWFVSGGRSSDFSVSHDARHFAAGVSLPYGYTLVDYTYSWSDYLSTIDNRGWRWRSTGDLQTHRWGLSHVLFRNGNMKTALTGGLQHRIIHNYLDDVLLQGSSRKLTSFSVGLNHTHKFLGGVGTLNPVFTRGMPWFGAESDHGKRGDLPVNQFRKWSVSASFQRPVTDRVWWLTSAYAQWSPDRLHGVEQLSLGGESSVRGFKEQYISGNNGGYLRNELSWSLFSLPYVGTVRAVAALDGGWLHSDSDDPYSSGTLWGGAAGLSTTSDYVSGSFTAGLPLVYPDWLAPDHLTVYWRVAVAF